MTDVKILSTGLAVGIILDATIVRGILAPALVALFGEFNWWLPDWLARLLRVEPLTRGGPRSRSGTSNGAARPFPEPGDDPRLARVAVCDRSSSPFCQPRLECRVDHLVVGRTNGRSHQGALCQLIRLASLSPQVLVGLGCKKNL